MAKTRTGSFPIGFRYNNQPWQRDLPTLIGWAGENGFEAIDVARVGADSIAPILAAGLRIGSIDLSPWKVLCVPDPARRKDSVHEIADYIRQTVSLGPRIFFSVAIAEDNAQDRNASFGYLADGLAQLCAAIEGTGAKIVFEGVPFALVCTPAEYRRLIQEVGSPAIGVNFDPSHLIRMDIDPVRFLEEFATRVFHCHAKDTEILYDDLYHFGNSQRNPWTKPHICGSHHWRYTIPGHGIARWSKLFGQLKAADYAGVVSIELEDEAFIATAEDQKQGFLASRDFLKYA